MLSLKGTDEHAPVIARMGSFNDFVPESYLYSMPTIVRRLENMP